MAWRTNPWLHFPSHIATLRDGITLRASLLSPNRFGYFPIVYRSDRDPFVHIGGQIERQPPTGLSFADYEERTGAELDYVLIWGLGEERPEETAFREVRDQLQDFRLLSTSSSGRLTLWGRN